jgi:hypothetical protein
MFPIKDNIPLARFPIVTVALVAINVVVYLHEIRHGGSFFGGPTDNVAVRYGAIPTAISASPRDASQPFGRPAVGSTGDPATRSASRKRHTWRALHPKMSPIARALSPSFTAARRELISGSAVAVPARSRRI